MESGLEKYHGIVKFYNQKAGFGFIIGPDNKQYYFKRQEIKTDVQAMKQDTAVVFNLKPARKSDEAINITLLTEE
jgi:cold shock CspA family protein